MKTLATMITQCMLLYQTFVIAFAQNNNVTTKNNKIKSIEDTFKLLEDGERSLIFGEYKDIVLVLGNTGSGKSTFTQFVAGDNTKLRGVEIGAGEFIIEDDNQRIGYGIYSKTVIPEQVIDVETNTAYVDFPGFSDTRNAAYDIAATYFTKVTVDHAKAIKIVLTISYSSVRIGVDRNDFMKLIKHTNEFIKNIEKYKDSIALVITKVDNEYVKRQGHLALVSNEQTINKIAKFIKNVRQTIYEKCSESKSVEESLYLEKVLILLDVFLQHDKSGYTNIVIFRRPDEEGLISDSKLLQNGKRDIKKLVESNLQFTERNELDFGFTISDNSKINIIRLIDKINYDIHLDISNTTDKMKEYYTRKVSKSYNLHSLEKEIGEMYHDLVINLNGLENTQSYKEFIREFIGLINEMGVREARSLLLNMLNKNKYVQFLELVSSKNFNPDSLKWTKAMDSVEKYVKELKIWHTFLIDLYYKLSDYETYNDFRTNYKKILNKRPKRNAEYNALLDTLKGYKINEYHNLPNINIDEYKIQDLNNVLTLILQDNVTVYCANSDSLVIKGDFIKFSDFLDKVYCNYTVRKLYIFSLNTVFIDQDFESVGDEMQLFIMAPRWEIVGDRRIVLDGAPGKELTDGKASLAQDGIPGLPGGNGGFFLGIAMEIVNGGLLTISANGGEGGTGQDGGNGIPGVDGYSVIPYGDQAHGENIMSKTGYRRLDSEKSKTVEGILDLLGYIIGITQDNERMYYEMNGAKGTVGGMGGRAGAGGKGGRRGRISIYGLKYDPKITISQENGALGSPGRGGNGGPGGKHEDNRYIVCTKKVSKWFGKWELKSRDKGWIELERTSQGSAKSGEYNTQISITGLKEPKPRTNIENLAYGINNYKLYMLENLSNNLKYDSLQKFYELFANNSDINSVYDSFGLLNELENIESQYYKLASLVDLDTFYKSLLSRINLYARNPKKYETTPAHKKLIHYLYTATLSKILTFSNGPGNNLIVDIDGYFELTLNNFKTIHSQTEQLVKREYNIKHKSNINAKITEAKNFIENQLSNDIDSILFQNEQQIEMLINEIIQLKNEALEEQIELLENQRKLMKAMEERGILETLGFVKKLLNTILPEFIFATNVIFSEVTEGLAENVNNYIKSNNDIPEGVKLLVSKGSEFIKKYINTKTTELGYFLNKMVSEVEKHPTTFGDMNATVYDAKSTLNSNENSTELEIFTSVTQTLRNMINLKTDDLKNKSDIEDSTNTTENPFADELKILDTFDTTLTLIETFTEVYHQNKKDERHMEEIAMAIKVQERNIIELQQYQFKVYDTIFPLFEMIKSSVVNVKQEPFTKSRLELFISGRKMQASFKEVKILLSKVTNGFQIQDEMLSFINKLDEAINSLIYILDQIHIYNEQKQLADYIAEIFSDRSAEIKTTNKTITNALTRLDTAIKSNIALAQYDKAIHNFKQFIFPFASYYFQEFIAPDHIKLELNYDNLIMQATTQLTILKSKLAENTAIIKNNFDEHIYEERFQRGEQYGGPFYVWNSYKYENVISKLLSGYEVVLKADILDVAHNRNAVKFNRIGLSFSSKSKSLADELAWKLKYFRISMKHLGNSYFRCDNKFYLLTSDPLTVSYSFESGPDGSPMWKNAAFTKLSSGPYILSPYATWTLQLKGTNMSFSELQPFKGNVDLELTGSGQYVGDENNVCEPDLNDYYEPADTISLTDFIDEIDSV